MAKIAYLLVLVALLATACAGIVTNDPACNDLEGAVFIQTATKTEWEAFRDALGQVSECTLNKIPYIVSNHENHKIVAFLGGVGPELAKSSAEEMINTFHPKNLLFSGTSGGLTTTVKIGDVLIVENWYNRDSSEAIAVSSTLLQLAKKGINGVVFVSNGVTSKTFVANPDEAAELSSRYAAAIVAMEDYEIAKVATTNGVNFLSVRSVSDMANGGVEKSNRSLAANNSAKLALQLAELISKQ